MALAEIGLRKNGIITDNDLDLSELHLAYFSYNFVVDPLEGTAGDGNYGDFIGKDNYLAGGGNLEYASRVLAMWTGAADEAIATYPSGPEYLPESLDAGIAYEDIFFPIIFPFITTILRSVCGPASPFVFFSLYPIKTSPSRKI